MTGGELRAPRHQVTGPPVKRSRFERADENSDSSGIAEQRVRVQVGPAYMIAAGAFANHAFRAGKTRPIIIWVALGVRRYVGRAKLSGHLGIRDLPPRWSVIH
jgi:hypothetical protein